MNSKSKKIRLILLPLLILTVVIASLYPIKVDPYGTYYKNLFAVYAAHGGNGGLFMISFPTRLEGASPFNFEIIHVEPASACPFTCHATFSYAKSGQTVYYDGDIVEEADGNSFKYIGDHYGIDNSYVFRGRRVQKDIDKDSFKYYDDSLASDKDNFYYQGFLALKRVSKDTLGSFNSAKTTIVKNGPEYNNIILKDDTGTYKLGKQFQVMKDDIYTINTTDFSKLPNRVDYEYGPTVYVFEKY